MPHMVGVGDHYKNSSYPLRRRACKATLVTCQPKPGIVTWQPKQYLLLKALWGGDTAALKFMLGRQLQVGERKHAIQSRRLQEEDIMATCIRHILQAMLALHICAIGLPRTGPIFQQKELHFGG